MSHPTTQEFCQYFERIRSRTRRVAELIPADRYDWTHQPNKFTFGDLLRHLAGAERYMFAENAMRRPSRYPGHERELADGRDAVLAYVDEKHGEAMKIFSELTDDDLRAKCVTPGGVSMAVWKWLRAMVEHEIHHRGQIYLMLGMIDVVTPPLYGLTSEEVYDRSEH